MAISIVETVRHATGGSAEKAARVSNASMARKMSIGSDWERIWLFGRFSSTYTQEGYFNVPTPGFSFGLCHNAIPRLDPSEKYFAGLTRVLTADSSYRLLASQGSWGLQSNSTPVLATVRDKTTVVSQASLGLSYPYLAGSTSSTYTDTRHITNCIAMQFHKTAATTIKITVALCNIIVAEGHVSNAVIAAAVETSNGNWATLTGNIPALASSMESQSVSKVESSEISLTNREDLYGALDSVSFCWPSSLCKVGLYSTLIAKLE